MFRFASLTSRIVFLHIVAVAVAAIFLPLLLLWLLNSEINQLHREAMRDQAADLGQNLSVDAAGKVVLNLPDSLRGLYSDAYGRYRYDIYDADGQLLFSSHRGAPRLPAAADRISGASATKLLGGQTLRIQVAEDLSHRDVIIDDIVSNFFRRVGWITIPILLILLATDILIFRRAVTPLLRASEEARSIGPARTDIRLPTEGIPSEILPLVTAVNQAFDRLEEGFHVQRQFTADAAHQLRTPLAILRTRIETLDEAKGTKELHADIESMSRIVSQLLEIAELDTLVLDPGETADLRAVRGNAEMLQRAIFNLAENAIKYTADATSVDVEVREDGSVQVRDCGPGIAPAEQGLIFQRFWRGDRQRQRTDGAGLGLSIVRGVVEDHDATVKVENLPSGGAQFTLGFRLA